MKSKIQCIPISPIHAPIVHDIMTNAFCYEPWTLSTIETSLSLGVDGYIATLNNIPVGYIICRSILGECEILSIGVSPNMQQQGIAQTLLETYENAFIEQSGISLFLEVAIDNAPAQNLYKKNGFDVTGKRPNYYHRPDGIFDAILMTKQIPNSN